jgi:excinuclease Cho
LIWYLFPHAVFIKRSDIFSKRRGSNVLHSLHFPFNGLFANRRAALQTLQSLADAEQLCYGLLGLESLTRGRACFRSALKRCAGACCGKESVEDHQRRLLTGLENIGVTCWPWDSAIALKESREGMTHYHIIHNWLWLGAVTTLDEAAELLRTPAGFDQDVQ